MEPDRQSLAIDDVPLPPEPEPDQDKVLVKILRLRSKLFFCLTNPYLS